MEVNDYNSKSIFLHLNFLFLVCHYLHMPSVYLGNIDVSLGMNTVGCVNLSSEIKSVLGFIVCFLSSKARLTSLSHLINSQKRTFSH